MSAWTFFLPTDFLISFKSITVFHWENVKKLPNVNGNISDEVTKLQKFQDDKISIQTTFRFISWSTLWKVKSDPQNWQLIGVLK